MKITSGKKEDILKRKREYDAKMDLYEADKKDREIRYWNAKDDVLQPVQEEVLQLLSQYNLLDFKVDASADSAHDEDYRNRKPFIRIDIRCNEWSKKDHALAWRVELKMDFEGNILRESSSWSGLEATSMDNIAELRQTVDALEMINTMDWTPLMTRALPKWEDYFSDAMERPEHQNFNQELAEAELEDLIGQNKVIKIHGWGESYTGTYYAKMVGQTASQWKLVPIPNYYMEYALADDEEAERYKQIVKDYNYDVRARKSSIHPVKDKETGEFTIVDLDTFQEV